MQVICDSVARPWLKDSHHRNGYFSSVAVSNVNAQRRISLSALLYKKTVDRYLQKRTSSYAEQCEPSLREVVIECQIINSTT